MEGRQCPRSAIRRYLNLGRYYSTTEVLLLLYSGSNSVDLENLTSGPGFGTRRAVVRMRPGLATTRPSTSSFPLRLPCAAAGSSSSSRLTRVARTAKVRHRQQQRARLRGLAWSGLRVSSEARAFILNFRGQSIATEVYLTSGLYQIIAAGISYLPDGRTRLSRACTRLDAVRLQRCDVCMMLALLRRPDNLPCVPYLTLPYRATVLLYLTVPVGLGPLRGLVVSSFAGPERIPWFTVARPAGNLRGIQTHVQGDTPSVYRPRSRC